MSNQPYIRVSNLSKTYQDGALFVSVLQSVNFTVSAGEQVAILGPSGSGKSTLLHLLGALDSPNEGTVFLGDADVYALKDREKAKLRNESLGFVYQFHHLLPEFSALENIMLPGFIAKRNKTDVRAHALYLLDAIGLQKRAAHKPAELSGGERQRVAIARAMMNKPKCVLADEPTGNLDAESAALVANVLNELNQQNNSSLIIVTHDLKLADKMDSRYYLEKGMLIRQ